MYVGPLRTNLVFGLVAGSRDRCGQKGAPTSHATPTSKTPLENGASRESGDGGVVCGALSSQPIGVEMVAAG